MTSIIIVNQVLSSHYMRLRPEELVSAARYGRNNEITLLDLVGSDDVLCVSDTPENLANRPGMRLIQLTAVGDPARNIFINPDHRKNVTAENNGEWGRFSTINIVDGRRFNVRESESEIQSRIEALDVRTAAERLAADNQLPSSQTWILEPG